MARRSRNKGLVPKSGTQNGDADRVHDSVRPKEFFRSGGFEWVYKGVSKGHFNNLRHFANSDYEGPSS